MTVMLSLAGYYASQAGEAEVVTRDAGANALARELATYRGAVLRYFGAHDEQRDTSVGIGALRAGGHLRGWSTLQEDQWANYRAADGTVYVYAVQPVGPDLNAALTRLAQGSLLAGLYRAGKNTLYSPVYGDTGIPLGPLLAHRTLPDRAPVWLGAAE